MANPVNFDGVNTQLHAPHGQEETVGVLPIFRNGVCCVSCWELTQKEVDEIVETHKIYLSVLSGRTQPPVYLGGKNEVRAIVADYGDGVWKMNQVRPDGGCLYCAADQGESHRPDCTRPKNQSGA